MLARAADDARVHGVPALRKGRRTLYALIRHADWASQTDGLKVVIAQQGAGILLTLFKATGRPQLVEEAVGLLEEAAGRLDGNDCRRPPVLANLAVALRNLGVERRDEALLCQAEKTARTASDLTADDAPEKPLRLSNLAMVLRSRYELTGDVTYLASAVDAVEAAYRIQPDAALANNLAAALHDLHARRGVRSDLERAIELTLTGSGKAARGSPIYYRLLANHALYRGVRFKLDGRVEDGEAIVSALREAAGMADAGSPDRPARLCNLGNAQLELYQRCRRRVLLKAAIASYEAAIVSPGLRRPQRRRVLVGLSTALAALGEADRDTDAIRRGVALARSALRACPKDGSQHAAYSQALATALRSLGLVTRSSRHLIEAMRLLEGETSPAGALTDPKLTVTKAEILADLFERTGEVEKLLLAATAAREGARVLRSQALFGGVQAGDIELAERISLRVGSLLAAAEEVGAAASMLEAARTVRFAAECIRRARAPEKGTEAEAEWLGAREAASRSRARLTQPADGTLEDQAARQEAARSLEAAEQTLARSETVRGMYSTELSAENIAEVAGRRDAILVYLFEDGGGGGVAVWRNGIARLQLPGLSAGSRNVGEPPVQTWLKAYQGAFGNAASEGGVLSWRGLLEPLLHRLGHACAEQLLRSAISAGVTRMVLLPAGSLALLPLHAATTADGRPLSELITVEYAPSAALLRAALDQPHPEPTIAAFGDADNDLPFARVEARAVAGGVWPLALGPEVARERVLGSLASAGRTHLAIHARHEPEHPLDSALYCAGVETIQLADLVSGEVALRPGAVVVASACETALFDPSIASGEQLGFAAAFIVAGARGVVATLWPVDDLSIAAIMRRASSAEGRGTGFGQALRDALCWIRTASGAEVAAELAGIDRSGDDPANRLFVEVELQKLQVWKERPFSHPRHWAGVLLLGVVDSRGEQLPRVH